VTGTYTNVTSASSPYTNTPAGSALFYRVKLVFYSKIESSLKRLQKQAGFEGVIFRTSICSAKF
jgi:hypothetical protein